MVVLFFFKQKTAYEMRISDWSSDVCSSDLTRRTRGEAWVGGGPRPGNCTWRWRWRPWRRSSPALARRAPVPADLAALGVREAEIGRASWGERVCQYV